MKKANKYFLVTLAVIVLDQTSKMLVYKYLYLDNRFVFPVIGKFFELLYVENPGMAFGFRLNNEFGKLALTIFRIAAMSGIAYYLFHMAKKGAHSGFLFCMALILGGATGNVIDSTFYGLFVRNNLVPGSPFALFHGQVIDMLHFHLFDFTLPAWMPIINGPHEFFSPVFNIADSSIFIGVVTILVCQKKFFIEKHKMEPGVNHSSEPDGRFPEMGTERGTALPETETPPTL